MAGGGGSSARPSSFYRDSVIASGGTPSSAMPGLAEALDENQFNQLSAAGKLVTPPTIEQQQDMTKNAAKDQAVKKESGRKGRASTMLTGPSGLSMGAIPTASKMLIGS